MTGVNSPISVRQYGTYSDNVYCYSYGIGTMECYFQHS
jgi:hypothetical protein